MNKISNKKAALILSISFISFWLFWFLMRKYVFYQGKGICIDTFTLVLEVTVFAIIQMPFIVYSVYKNRKDYNMNIKIFKMPFSTVYPLYIQKAEKKERTKAEVDEIIFWLTGYNQETLQQHLELNTDLETFFKQAPQINPNASKIIGVICGCRVEEIEDIQYQQIRYLDKLIDELAKGKPMEKILRK